MDRHRGVAWRYGFLLVQARSGADADGATPRRPGCVIFGGFPRQLRYLVPDLSAYGTKGAFRYLGHERET
jgi:hypothetical protein